MARTPFYRTWPHRTLRRASMVVALVVVGLGPLGLVSSCNPASSTVRQPRSSGAPSGDQLLPVGLRRLTNREFRKISNSLLGFDPGLAFEAALPPDVRQEEGYARNIAQTMSGTLAVKLEQLVPALAQRALTEGTAGFTCTDGAAPCVALWIADTARRAWRRPVAAGEVARLTDVYRAGRAGGGESRGVEEGAAAVLTALLLSPDLWYVRELGEPWRHNADEDRREGRGRPTEVELSGYEIADQIAIVMRGTLADSALLADAEKGALADAEVRKAHARRLLSLSDTRDHYREFVASWLEIDELSQTSKSAAVFERFDAFKGRMLAETENFVDAVFVSEGASVGRLLDAGFVSVDPEMAVFYGLGTYGMRVKSEDVGRVGVLQHASFLASHSHADTTSPVLRGDFVLRKVLCHRLPRPSELDIEVIMPRPRRDMTRREQFAFHGADPRCAECHDQIDGFGLVFEEFDAAGRRRGLELGKPVRTDGQVRFRGQLHRFASSSELVRWLARHTETEECFARQLFRFVTGRVEPRAEAAFLELRSDLDAASRGNVLEHLVAYVGSPLFVQRRRP